MTKLTRMFAIINRVRIPMYVFAVIASVALAYPGGLGAMYHNAQEMTQLSAEMEQLENDRARMDQECVLAANRIALKEAMIEELITGRRTLRDVAEEFARISGNDPCQSQVLQAVYACSSELEFNARNVLCYAEQRSGTDSVKERVMVELNRQYRELMAE